MMKKNLCSLRLLWVAALMQVVLSAQAAPPRILFSDLTSGPAAGGENGGGAYVTLYGTNFGSAPGGVVIGGKAATTYKLWGTSYQRFQVIAFQVPAGTPQGATTIVVTNSGGSSNALPFTVRAGNIYSVQTSGNDSNSGSFSSPWKSLTKARDSVAAGDIAYIGNGVSQTSIDNYAADFWLGDAGSGTAASPKALVAYPGAKVLVGDPSTTYAMRGSNFHAANDYWTIAGFTLVSGNSAMDMLGNNGWRFIGNDLSCPKGSGQSACFHSDTTINLAFYGNYVHNVGDAAGSIDKYYHGVYFTTNSNHIDAGWNVIVPNPNHSTTSGGCRAMQFYSTGGADQYDLHVHDNLIHDAICDGINFSTVNANQGPVEAYNNVVYHVGTGPDPYDGSSNYACVNTGTSSSPTANIEIYNNTFSDCGSRGTSDSGAFTNHAPARLRNNIVLQTSSETYINNASSGISGSNNLWFGAGNGPSQTTGNVNANPLVVSASTGNFALNSSSPAIDAGVTIATLGYSFDGIVRPQGAGYDIGAYEYFKGSGTTSNRCDLNGDGVVNSADVQIAVNQAIGISACGSADLVGNSSCNSVDVQRVVNASLGQTCKVGP